MKVTLNKSINKRAIKIFELAAALLLLILGYLKILPFNATPFIVIYGIIVILLLKEKFSEIGFNRKLKFGYALLAGLILGVVQQYLSLYGIEPLLAKLTGELPDVSLFEPLVGNLRFLLISLAISWSLAAFGEEFVYRGYLMSRIARIFGNSIIAWIISLFITSALFGLAHIYQGTSGVLTTGLSGLFYGCVFLIFKRNLWVPIFAHGASNTIGFILIYFGKYPGIV